MSKILVSPKVIILDFDVLMQKYLDEIQQSNGK